MRTPTRAPRGRGQPTRVACRGDGHGRPVPGRTAHPRTRQRGAAVTPAPDFNEMRTAIARSKAQFEIMNDGLNKIVKSTRTALDKFDAALALITAESDLSPESRIVA